MSDPLHDAADRTARELAEERARAERAEREQKRRGIWRRIWETRRQHQADPRRRHDDGPREQGPR